MKEDYLWDKTGTADPEIERLEKALAVFRYQVTEPPALPAKIIPFERKSPKSFFRLVFAFGACAAVVAICFGVWLQTSGNKAEIAKDSPQTNALQINEKAVNNEKAANAISVRIPDDLIVEKVELPKSSMERKIVKTRNVALPKTLQNKTIVQTVEVKKPDVKLTKEEKFAYDQLMLALSITSSKFKMVKDKVDGTEEKNAVRENAR